MPMSREKLKERNERARAVQAASLVRRNELLAYIDQHGPVSTTAIQDALNIRRSSIFKWLRDMQQGGWVTCECEPGNGTGIRSQNVWSRGPNHEPLRILKGGSTPPGRKSEVTRPRGPAPVKVGVEWPHLLPRAFFGMAGASAYAEVV